MLLPLKDYEIFLSNISSFKNEEFDVLKCDAQSMNLYKTNREITDKFETHSNYKEYHPHIRGMCKDRSTRHGCNRCYREDEPESEAYERTSYPR